MRESTVITQLDVVNLRRPAEVELDHLSRCLHSRLLARQEAVLEAFLASGAMLRDLRVEHGPVLVELERRVFPEVCVFSVAQPAWRVL